uniref:AMP-activated protein kinase glycogen-binding domain-containing protein n=1 Tax=Oryza meridionalis TaxID=40149 RepID=A0A0E0D4Q2_9ORYZ
MQVILYPKLEAQLVSSLFSFEKIPVPLTFIQPTAGNHLDMMARDDVLAEDDPSAEKQHRNATEMLPLLLPLPVTPPPLPSPTLTLAPSPSSAPRRLVLLAAAAPHHHHRRRRVYRRQRAAPPPPPPQAPRTSSNAARGEEDLEEAIYEFMRRSDKPGAFPTRAELVAAGRADLAAAVDACGGWLSLGWPSGGAEAGRASSSVGVHPNYPPEAGAAAGGASDLAQGAAWASSREAEASPSGRQPETEEEETETNFGTGLDGMLTRLQRERERVRPPLPRRSDGAGGERDNVALMGQSGAPSHSATGGRYTPKVPDNGNIHSSHPQNGALEHNKGPKSLTNDAWRTWSLDKGGFSDFQAAEIHSTNSRKSFRHDGLDILAQDDMHGPSNGVAVHDYDINDVDSERDDIHARLQNLELDLTAALHTLRSRFDKVISDMSEGDGAKAPNGLSDDWEFEETKVMQAQEELRSIRAKIAVLEGKMALEIIEKNKIIEEKQRRLDEAEKALSELRTVYIVWSNPASEVLLTGSFDGWTSQRRMERSERGTFSLNLRLYPGRYEIKFIVDGVWRNDPLRPLVSNNGHENNLLTVYRNASAAKVMVYSNADIFQELGRPTRKSNTQPNY